MSIKSNGYLAKELELHQKGDGPCPGCGETVCNYATCPCKVCIDPRRYLWFRSSFNDEAFELILDRYGRLTGDAKTVEDLWDKIGAASEIEALRRRFITLCALRWRFYLVPNGMTQAGWAEFHRRLVRLEDGRWMLRRAL